MSITKGTLIYIYTSDESKLENKFTSARKAAEYFSVNKITILSYCKNGEFFKDKWIFIYIFNPLGIIAGGGLIYYKFYSFFITILYKSNLF